MPKKPKHLRVLKKAFLGLVRVLVGAYPMGAVPNSSRPTIYFANHTSHLDTLTLLAALGPRGSARARPIAARDYWCASRARQWVAQELLNAVFVDRLRAEETDPLQVLRDALNEGSSVILFPEGTRTENELPTEFKSGLFRLAQEFPQVRLVPVYLENLHRILPKGSVLPVPLINKVHFGEPLQRIEEEPKADFLARARQAVCNLSPGH